MIESQGNKTWHYRQYQPVPLPSNSLSILKSHLLTWRFSVTSLAKLSWSWKRKNKFHLYTFSNISSYCYLRFTYYLTTAAMQCHFDAWWSWFRNSMMNPSWCAKNGCSQQYCTLMTNWTEKVSLCLPMKSEFVTSSNQLLFRYEFKR